MSGDDQERFEDYLELESYIEDLQAGRAAHLPQHLTPSQASIYHMAAQFCSASPKADEPRTQFVTDLKARLLEQLEEEQQEPTEKHAAINARQHIPLQEEQQAVPLQEIPQVLATTSAPTTTAEPAPTMTPPVRRVRFISRRAMLAGGAVAAASLAIGAELEATLNAKVQANEQATQTPTLTPTPDESYDQPWLVYATPNGVPTTWHFVTTLAQLGNQAVQFIANGVIGYVILKGLDQKDKQSNNEVVAISATCTHMGCIVQWQHTDRSFHCPCHGGLFTQYGLPDDSSPMRYLAALPRLRVKIENENIYVEVPKAE